MDLSKIFLKDACPTPIGGQAVMEGVMMKGLERTAITIRLPDGRMHIKTMQNSKHTGWAKIPILRGVIIFFLSLVSGMKCLLYSADVLEASMDEEPEEEEPGKFETWVVNKFGEKWAWNMMIYLSVIFSIVVTVVVFILFPTVAVNLLSKVTKSHFVLNLAEGILRIVLFILYILAISHLNDIQRVFQYHGAEHKTIHCFENNLELTPENAQQFYTLHPRCGTSFLMFVMIISLILFSMLGWPSLLMRVVSRIVLVPVVAGLSYELLRWAGKSDNGLVKVLSMPGLYLQKLTTRDPSDDQLEIAIASMKAVMVKPDTPYIEGYCNLNGELIEERIIANRE